ncbi:MAG: CDP-diacylglycerol--glycerol-3-phosphate 3-phosphatidyltransferase [Lentisphaerae bacterium]|jgi:CDP-diacylglycerol---serine O-phosphatidyltransferase|nr:CDP-diacylglycerol--glycerol-3-phosphate 3-phosphatidyltransferase [Lentisphaerota bacterium]MBT4821660.1 CDP-diacylglycerol--glycerol-3-phosphate 3-phosphatidyltransferase [Lentisphaerota bacterium]MBT5610360.1 CDP-diacylglycerol--glycerol-3-phosphate 3-phosphatidyltransferase [Lentisphaerota bacterium]MBT7056188.1 CDP-diacylglycerol--glycerol-3-phosphate 3-phosphatidyltransferase [Lentisphaerota bacterium]MBT7841890.1 CDP-diacylglycerol--glycerol-3-phosphate 3-phosphatidyltransferase [Lent
MVTVWIIFLCVIGALVFERLTVGAVTRHPKGREWVRSHKVFHPNSISLIRIPMGAVSVAFWWAGWEILAILWFSAWMITDLTDGTIARNCDLATETGKWLDPLSDKCMYFPPLIYFAARGVLPEMWVGVLVVTDSIGQLSRLFTHKKAANYFGKAKTALITTLLSLIALNQMQQLWFMSPRFIGLLTVSCGLLAFLSFYCKVVPDVWYANSLTLANFLCGLAAAWNIQSNHPLRAFILVFVGQFFDLFDGRMARKFGSTRHGPVFDDIADGTTFGLVIAFLIFHELAASLSAFQGAVLAAVYVLCVCYRLYRFLNPPSPLPRGIFRGMPSPAGAMLAGASILLFSDRLPLLAAGLVLVTSGLMVCSIRYRHFGQRIWPGLPNTMKLLVLILLLIFVSMSFADKNYAGSFMLFCFTVAATYAIYGIDYRRTPEDPEEKDDRAEEPVGTP